jgi:hypothetical protein
MILTLNLKKRKNNVSTRYIHRHGIGGKFHVKLDVEIIHSFNKSDTSDLK